MSRSATYLGGHNDFSEHMKMLKSVDESASISQVIHYCMKTMHNDDNLTYKYTEDPVGDQCYEKRNELDSTQDLSRQPNLYIMSSYS